MEDNTNGVAGKPPFDSNELLRAIEELIRSKSIETGIKDPLGRVGKSALWALLIPILIITGIAVVAWLSRGSQRELAKLRHDQFKTKAMKDGAEFRSVWYGVKDEVIPREKKAFEEYSNRLRRIEADIEAEEKRHEANIDTLRRIRAWDDSYKRRYGG